MVVFRTPANYGYEYLLTEISKKFKQKIHIDRDAYKDYFFIPEFDNCFSQQLEQCGRIHLCSCNSTEYSDRSWADRTIECLPDLDEQYVRVIRPTAMRWNGWDAEHKYHAVDSKDTNVVYVCYSTHSSYEEIRDFLSYLKPKAVKMNVMPNCANTRADMARYLDEIVNEYEMNEEISIENHSMTQEITVLSRIEFNNIQINNIFCYEEKFDDVISRSKIKRRKRC